MRVYQTSLLLPSVISPSYRAFRWVRGVQGSPPMTCRVTPPNISPPVRKSCSRLLQLLIYRCDAPALLVIPKSMQNNTPRPCGVIYVEGISHFRQQSSMGCMWSRLLRGLAGSKSHLVGRGVGPDRWRSNRRLGLWVILV
jgi:hypothetical protein